MPVQKYFIPFLLGGFLVAGIALAQNREETDIDTLDPAEIVTAADLGVEDAGILPTSRLYFFKEFTRGIRSFFTFNFVKKVELELGFANEKVAEAKKVQETNPNNESAIKKAVENYQKSQERLKVRLESLKETSQNPNIDRLLDQLAEKTVKHEKVLEEIALKAKDMAGVDEFIQKAKERIEESTVAGASKDDPFKFTARLEKSFIESKGSELKHVRSLEILDRISKKAPDDLKDSIKKLREEFSERVKEDIEEILETKTPEALTQALENLPGDSERRLHVIEELQEKATKQTAEALKNVAKGIEKTVRSEKRIAQKAAEQIEDAAERIEKLEKKMGEVSSVPENVSNLAATAREHLERAKIVFEGREFGEAFGQARSAESAARNASRVLEDLEEAEEEEEEEDVKAELQEKLQELEFKIQKHEALVEERGFVREENPEIFKLLEQAKQHLRFANDVFSVSDLEKTKLYIDHVKAFLKELARAIELQVRFGKGKPSEEKKPEVCIQIFDPVCGVDGKTYSNSCFARVAGVGVKHKGECRKVEEEKIQPESSKPIPEETTALSSLIVELKLEADDSGFYPSSEIRVRKGAKVKLTFLVRKENVYFGGLDFRSSKFKTESVKPGESTTIEFVADERFEFTSWWPASQRLKATGKVIVQ